MAKLLGLTGPAILIGALIGVMAAIAYHATNGPKLPDGSAGGEGERS